MLNIVIRVAFAVLVMALFHVLIVAAISFVVWDNKFLFSISLWEAATRFFYLTTQSCLFLLSLAITTKHK